jgi:hypothetical protein
MTTFSITIFTLKGLFSTLSIECRYDERSILFIVMLSSVFMLNVIELSVIVLNVVMLIVVGPFGTK